MQRRAGVMGFMIAVVASLFAGVGLYQSEAQVAEIDKELVAAAAKEGELVWYSTAGLAESKVLLAEFEKRFPAIRTKIFFMVAGPMTERVRAERARGQVGGDVMDQTGGGAFLALRAEGAFDPFEPKGLELWPPDLQPYKPEGYVARVGENAVVYNTKLVKLDEARTLTTWDRVVDPRWKGKMIIVDPHLTGSWAEGFYNIWKIQGEEWFAKLKALNPVIFNANVAAADSLAKGEYAIGLLSTAPPALAFSKGAPLNIVYPNPTPAYQGIIAVLKGGPHPNAARLFVTWLLGAEGQSAWSQALNAPPALPASPDRRPIASAPGYARPEKYIFADSDALKKERSDFFKVWDKYFRK